jgi:hypothetical protein
VGEDHARVAPALGALEDEQAAATLGGGTAKSRLHLSLRRIADRLQSEGLAGEW